MQARWYQDEASESVFDFVQRKPEGAPLIALPTGTGKGVVIGHFINRVFRAAPRTRVMMMTHVATLITQNAKKLTTVWPLAPLGIYSAGLNSRDQGMPITFAGIQSIYKIIEQFGWIDIVIIDEAHLLSPKSATMYQIALQALKKINPMLVIIGLTATAYRMGQGDLTEGDGIFTDICYDMTDIKGFNRLIAEGFLSPLYPKRTETTLDVSGVGIVNGEFKKGELERAVDDDKITRKCLAETCHFGANRDHWMVFASGIHHAERIADILTNEFGVPSVPIHSQNSNDKNREYVEGFESGKYRCAVNMNKLTTGYDFAPIDLIVHLRPSQSAGLWVQMNGRGTRPSEETGKRDCLALDFAGNTKRLGPINDPFKPRAKGKGGGDAPVRLCDACGVYNPAAARVCFCCGAEFTFAEKLLTTSSTEEIIRSDAPVIETFPVKHVIYSLHQKRINNIDGTISYGVPCMKVTYFVGFKPYYEWVHLDSPGYPGHKSREWWRQRHAYEPPTPQTCHPFTSATAAALSLASQLKEPKFIRVWTNTPKPEVRSVEY